MKKIKINFVDFWHSRSEDDIKQNPLYLLLKKKFDIEISDKPEFIIYSSSKFGKRFLFYRCVRIFYTGENERPNFYDCDYSFSFDYTDDIKNYRLPLYKFYCDLGGLTKKRHPDEIITTKNKFCSFLVSNPEGKERVKFFEMLSQYKKVDSGGAIFNNLGRRIKNRSDLLINYKFSISFENSSYPGYTTEKIIMPFLYNVIPIYWGNPLIYKEFNVDSFVNCHDFSDFSQVVDRIIEIDNDNNLYRKYLEQPIFLDNKVPDYLTDDAILGRFEQIFNSANEPVGTKVNNYFKIGGYYFGNYTRRVFSYFKSFRGDA